MLNKTLKNKQILFFSVQTFNLERDIVEFLEKKGAIVTYYDERPSNSNFTKGILRLRRSIYENKIRKYYNAILDEIKRKHFDYLFVNRGEIIPEFFLEEYIKMFPNCKRIFYTWDSFDNHSHPVNILKYFHKRFTFDPADALNYNIGLRPLYFNENFSNIRKDKDKTFDLLFLGTAHSDRYLISSKVKKWCVERDLSAYCYYYMHGRLVYFYKKLFDKSFKHFDFKDLSFESLTKAEMVLLYQKSNVVLDINHPGQKGLTMRTFECIGSNSKMITTNQEVKKYAFYHPDNIHVFDRNLLMLDEDIFCSEYNDIPESVYGLCSMNGWIEELFFSEESQDWNGLYIR